MTLADFNTLLTGTGLPVSYSSVPLDINTARPYICYFQDADRNFAADGVVYYSRKVLTVRLYTDYRDETSEGLVENALTGLYWSKDISFLDDEKLYEIQYTIEV